MLERSLPSEISDIVDCLRGFGEEITCVGLEAGSLIHSQTGRRAFALWAGSDDPFALAEARGTVIGG